MDFLRLPDGFEYSINPQGLTYRAPSWDIANEFLEQELERLQATADRWGVVILCWPNSEQPYRILGQRKWEYFLSQNGIRYEAPNQDAADHFLEAEVDRLVQLALMIQGTVEISWPFCETPLRITPAIASLMSKEKKGMAPSTNHQYPSSFLKSLVQSPEEYDFGILYNLELPFYITEMKEQGVLFGNPYGLRTQQKTAAQFRVENAAALADSEELEQRDKALLDSHSKSLLEYDYYGWRWFKDPDTGIYLRKRMHFVSNFWVLNYGNMQLEGIPCRGGLTLYAEETGKFVE